MTRRVDILLDDLRRVGDMLWVIAEAERAEMAYALQGDARLVAKLSRLLPVLLQAWALRKEAEEKE